MAVATVIGTLVTLCGQRRARQVPAKSSQNPACFGVCLVGAQSRTSVALNDRSSSSLSGALPRRHAVAEGVLTCMQTLYDADDDPATAGSDLSRRINPVVSTITADGFE